MDSSFFKKPKGWITMTCWIVVLFQTLYILQSRHPHVLQKVGIEPYSYQFFSKLGLLERDHLWELSQNNDRRGLKRALGEIDRYSRYLNEDEFDAFSVDSQQKYVGIGVSLMDSPRGAEIREVFENGPADRAQLVKGDVITHLNGTNVQNWNFSSIVDQVRGAPGSVLHVRVVRENERIDKSLRRRSIEIPSITDIHRTQDEILYMRIEQFGERTASEFYRLLRSYSGQTVKGIVIDLRENTGGVLKTSIEMLDAFYDSGESMLQTRSTNSRKNRNYTARHPALLDDIPTVILVNRNTASAAEILAGSLQVSGKALIIGEQTLGKGSIQTVYRLRDGDGYKKTTSYYYFPDGSSIHDVGIKPDISISSSPQQHFALRIRFNEGIAPFQTDEDFAWNRAVAKIDSW